MNATGMQRIRVFMAPTVTTQERDRMGAVGKTSGNRPVRARVRDFAPRSGPATAGQAGEADSSRVRPEVRDRAASLRLVRESDEARAERVRSLKEQIANGTYKLDPRAIAKRMLELGF